MPRRSLLAAMVLLALTAAQTPPRDPDPDADFVEATLKVVEAASPRKTRGSTRIAVVVGGQGNPHKAADMMVGLRARATKNFAALGNVTVSWHTLPDDTDASKVIPRSTDAVVILQASRRNLNSLLAFSTTYHALTISRRAQDLGEVSIVILPPHIYLDTGHLRDENVTLGESMKTRCKEPTSVNHKQEFLSAQQDAEKQGGKKDWQDIIRRYRLAMRKEKREDRTPLRSRGNTNVPYAPHFYLSEALARDGDCEGAEAEWLLSDPAVRGTIQPVRKVTEVDTLVHKNCKRQKEGTIAWLTGSF